MLDRLKSLFTVEEVTPTRVTIEERVRLATCVVLLEAARIDEEFSDEERVRILARLRERYSLDESDARELLAASRESRDSSVDLWHFTNQINEFCDNAEKLEIVEEAWRVVVADGGIHGNESHFMRQLGTLLNLTHRHVIDAKVKVLAEVRGESSDNGA